MDDLPRQCGPCTACCNVMEVEEIKKPANVTCRHVIPTIGCKIYEKRPDSCRAFACEWVNGNLTIEGGEIGPDVLRPDKFGLMFAMRYKTIAGDVLAAWEVWPGAAEKSDCHDLLVLLSERQLVLIFRIGKDRKFVGPPEQIEELKARMAERVRLSGRGADEVPEL